MRFLDSPKWLPLVLGGLLSCGRPEILPPEPADLSSSPSRLQALLEARRNESSVNYEIGRGDLLRIRVQQMEELNGQFRVSEQGSLVLPLLGSVPVATMTERQAAEKLRGQLRDFIKDPQVTVAVAEINGSQVSIMGAVARPGVYPIRGFDQTIADVITQAGGIGKEGGSEIYFSPAGESGDGNEHRDVESLALGAGAPGLFAGRQQAVPIELSPLYQGKNVPELSIPVRAGDMIVIPPAGEVFVDGWVNNPGAIRLTRGMTISQAISNTGGIHFGGSTSRVTLQRKTTDGQAKEFAIDYDSVSKGGEKDVVLAAGDRISVGANPAKAGPWALYGFVKSIFSFGVGGSLPRP